MTAGTRILAAVAVLSLGVFADMASAVPYDSAKRQAHGSYAELAQDPVLVAGGWEYILDFYAGGNLWTSILADLARRL